MTHVEARRRMTGLEFFQRMIAGEMPPPPMLDLLGIRIAEVEEGRVVFTAVCEESFYNGTGVAHGGFAATMLDTALGCAIKSATPARRPPPLPHIGIEGEPAPADHEGSRSAAVRGEGGPRRRSHRDIRRPHRR